LFESIIGLAFLEAQTAFKNFAEISVSPGTNERKVSTIFERQQRTNDNEIKSHCWLRRLALSDCKM
jgi:hypothetical protein